jgi:hypothetical protein
VTRLPLTICLALAWFAAIDALVSGAVAAAACWWRLRTDTGPARATLPANVALAARLLPFVTASAYVCGVFLPAFLAYEPAGEAERVGSAVLAAAAVALALGTIAAARGVIATRRARALVNTWLCGATPIQLDPRCGTGITAYAVEHRFPVVALAGVWCPRLFVARQVLDALSPDELLAAVAHEAAHRRAWDNVKRFWFCWSPDLLGWTPIGRWLEREWAAAAECAADRRAAAASPRRGVALAGALLKVSRLAVAPPSGVSLFSTLHEGGDVADRVARLVAPAAAPHPAFRNRLLAGMLLIAVAAASWLSQSWAAIHAMSESCLRLLP